MRSSLPTPVDVVVVDNVDAIRSSLASLPNSHPMAIASVSTFAGINDVDFTATPPDVVVLDLWLERDSTPSTPHVRRLRDWGASVLIYTTEERPYPLQAAMAAGADGVSLKNDGIDALVQAIIDVASGQRGLSGPMARALLEHRALTAALTPKEIETLRALSYGKSPEEIATSRFVSTSTIGTQIESIRRKYADAVGSRVNQSRMLAEGARDGYVDLRYLDAEDPEIS